VHNRDYRNTSPDREDANCIEGVDHLQNRSPGGKIGPPLDAETFEYIHEVFADEDPVVVAGRVSSYNSNTFKGRIYVASEGRPIAFELSEGARSNTMVRLIVASLSFNAIQDRSGTGSVVYCVVQRNTSRSGHLKNYTILQVSHSTLS
jgi:hypothetical protein